MSKEVDILRVLEKLTSDGYDLELCVHQQSLKVSIMSDNGRYIVNRFIPVDATPRALAKIYWDMSSSIKRIERKLNV
jgi:hypothetical protein